MSRLDDLPLLPVQSIGSAAAPPWVWLLRDAVTEGRLGPSDIGESLRDAARVALLDQQEAGYDVVSDGEMLRADFTRTFHAHGLFFQHDLNSISPSARIILRRVDDNRPAARLHPHRLQTTEIALLSLSWINDHRLRLRRRQRFGREENIEFIAEQLVAGPVGVDLTHFHVPVQRGHVTHKVERKRPAARGLNRQ